MFSPSHLHISAFSLSLLLSSHLLICTSVHLHIFSSSHHSLIFTSVYIYIFSSSHLFIFTSSYLHICSSSHLLIFTSLHSLLPYCSLLLFYFSLEGAGQCQRDGTKRNPFARNEVRSPKTEVKLRFWFALVRVQPFRTKWCSIAKNWSKIAILICACPTATLSHEMRIDRQKLRYKIAICKASGATLSHEMRFDRQKLK